MNELAIGDILRIDVEGCPPRVLNDYRFPRHANIVSFNKVDRAEYVTIGWPDGWQVGVKRDAAIRMREAYLAEKGRVMNEDNTVTAQQFHEQYPRHTTDITAVAVGAFVQVTPRNGRVMDFVAEVKAIMKDGRYILWYGKYEIWERHEFVEIELAVS